MSKRIVVAMSGGVDSSVAAFLLKKAGWEVIGITMKLFSGGEERRETSCCSLEASSDARAVADQIRIPHYVLDLSDVFRKKVITDFCREYVAGRTPNPCIRCNQHVKFDELMKKTAALGAAKIATGHYARIEYAAKDKRFLLKKAIDKNKDQSYFLFPMTQEQLSRTVFPLGSLTKKDVREIARKNKLKTFSKPESQEICFAPDDYRDFLGKTAGEAFRPGPIVGTNGEVIGTHRGTASYTVGQRRHIGIAAGHPLYVLSIVPERNTIVVGEAKDLLRGELHACAVNWIIERPGKPRRFKAKIRSRQAEAACTVYPGNAEARVVFETPQKSVTPGQAVVFYERGTIAGGGWIK